MLKNLKDIYKKFLSTRDSPEKMLKDQNEIYIKFTKQTPKNQRKIYKEFTKKNAEKPKKYSQEIY
ncbi:23776_t:CDS:2 [Cetraspora pellucida]|uniref:23776_t:CDS:1 n=1 Tax=Cetraspora pellucida TaxID=1433469 RepID=A0A9N8WQV0_9GLOM|nr:23776_t:CDS:2 [Cetraspora pellucida]